MHSIAFMFHIYVVYMFLGFLVPAKTTQSMTKDWTRPWLDPRAQDTIQAKKADDVK